MKSHWTVSELRAALSAAERKGAGRPYPEELREAAVTYFRHRREQGARAHDVEAELGVSGISLSRWSRRPTSLRPSFRQVEIVEAHPEPSASCSVFVVHGPGGVRIEGMAVAEVAELLRRLS
jgi:transposase